MAQLDDVRNAVAELDAKADAEAVQVAEMRAELINAKDVLSGEVADLSAQVVALQEQLANGSVVTAEDLDEIVGSLRASAAKIENVYTPEAPVGTDPQPEPEPEVEGEGDGTEPEQV